MILKRRLETKEDLQHDLHRFLNPIRRCTSTVGSYDHAVSFLLSGFESARFLEPGVQQGNLVEDINNQGESMANTELSDSIWGRKMDYVDATPR